jgi:hypothetical protein
MLCSKSIFNQVIIVPGVENLLPGSILFNLTTDIIFKRPRYIGSQIILDLLPYSSFLSFLGNNSNNR